MAFRARKELLQLTSKKPNHLLESLASDLHRHFPKEDVRMTTSCTERSPAPTVRGRVLDAQAPWAVTLPTSKCCLAASCFVSRVVNHLQLCASVSPSVNARDPCPAFEGVVCVMLWGGWGQAGSPYGRTLCPLACTAHGELDCSTVRALDLGTAGHPWLWSGPLPMAFCSCSGWS